MINPATGMEETEEEARARMSAPASLAMFDIPRPAPDPFAASQLGPPPALSAPPREPTALPSPIVQPAPSAPLSLPLPVPALPGKQVERGSTTTTRTKIDPLEQKGINAEIEAGKESTKIAEREAAALEKVNKAKTDGLHEQRVQAETDQAAQSLLADHWNAKIKEDEGKYEKAVAERSKMKLEKFGEGDPQWKTIGRAVLLGLGEIGASLSKSNHNPVRDIIDAQAKEHYMLQQKKLDEGDKQIELADKAMGRTHQRKVEDQVDLERNRAATEKALQFKIQEQIAQAGTDHAKVTGEQLINDSKKREAEAIQKLGAIRRVQVSSTSEWSNTTGAGAGGPGGKPLTGTERTNAEAATSSANALDTAAELIEKNPKAWASYQKHLKDQKASDQLASSSFGKGIMTLSRGAQAIPLGLEQRLTTPEERAIHSALAPVITAKAREMDPVGVLDASAKEAGESRLGLSTRAPHEIAKEIRAQAARQRAVAAANAGASGYQPPSAQQGRPAQAPQGRRVRLKNGKTGILEADGVTFHPDGQ